MIRKNVACAAIMINPVLLSIKCSKNYYQRDLDLKEYAMVFVKQRNIQLNTHGLELYENFHTMIWYNHLSQITLSAYFE